MTQPGIATPDPVSGCPAGRCTEAGRTDQFETDEVIPTLVRKSDPRIANLPDRPAAVAFTQLGSDVPAGTG